MNATLKVLADNVKAIFGGTRTFSSSSFFLFFRHLLSKSGWCPISAKFFLFCHMLQNRNRETFL